MLSHRRSFLVSAAAAAQSWAQSNDRLRVAIVGVGSRGSAHINELLPVPNLEIAALVEVDGARAEAASQKIFAKTGKRPLLHTDMRRAFDDKSIDAVTIATTNHWHALTAIWAMQAGKDVYVEKPVSHNIFEGTQHVKTARKYTRIAAGGTQRRWWGPFRTAVELLHAGVIGDIYQGNFFFPGGRDSLGFKPVTQPPANLNWDLWVGPAPMQDYHANLVPYNWHWFWDFGNGELGNNGIHMIDILRWGMKQTLPVSVRSTGGRFGYKDQGQTPNTQNVTWTFADAVRARNPKLLHAEIEETALSTALCHLGNISHRLGRELRFDPAKMVFPNDAEANKMLTREYRAPYVVPTEV